MKRIFIAAIALLVVLVAAVFIYFNLIRDDAPEEFGLTTSEEADNAEAAEAAGGTDDAGADDSSADDGTTDDATTEAAEVEIDGTWSVVSGSEAGYRVVEDLGSIQDFEAVGRTSQVTGSIEISGTSITSGSFEVDVASIVSDDTKRDGQFVGPIMNAAEFPTATLALAAPIDLGSEPVPGTPIETSATGDLTLRDATNSVTFPVSAQLLGDQIEIVASVDVLFSDYGIENPTNPFVKVRDEGKVEVKLLLDKG